jgi:hypothetical protein
MEGGWSRRISWRGDAAISEAIADDQLLAGSDPKPSTLASIELTDRDLHDIVSSFLQPGLHWCFRTRGWRRLLREYW